MGPRMLPCGTPAVTVLEEEQHPSMTTHFLRPFRWLRSKSSWWPHIPETFSFVRRRPWSIQPCCSVFVLVKEQAVDQSNEGGLGGVKFAESGLEAFSYIQTVWKAAKLQNKNLSSKSALLIPTLSATVFHSTNLFLFSRHHIPTNSVAPFSAYKPTHNPQFLQSL